MPRGLGAVGCLVSKGQVQCCRQAWRGPRSWGKLCKGSTGGRGQSEGMMPHLIHASGHRLALLLKLRQLAAGRGKEHGSRRIMHVPLSACSAVLGPRRAARLFSCISETHRVEKESQRRDQNTEAKHRAMAEGSGVRQLGQLTASSAASTSSARCSRPPAAAWCPPALKAGEPGLACQGERPGYLPGWQARARWTGCCVGHGTSGCDGPLCTSAATRCLAAASNSFKSFFSSGRIELRRGGPNDTLGTRGHCEHAQCELD